MQVTSKLITLEELVQLNPPPRFSVPIYQRLYVWGKDQVRILLEDMKTAYQSKKDFFFLGSALVVEREDNHGTHLELIDGQQRFTTLWLLAATWQKTLNPFLAVNIENQQQSRLQFAIRPEVNRFLQRQIKNATDSETVEEILATSRMRDAVALMQEAFPKGSERWIENLADLTDFIFKKVKMVLTTVPVGTDLNKLFEIINNRGVQLQHHEILKARMLDALREEERNRYAVLWDACADMSDYVERNFRSLVKNVKLIDLYNVESAKNDEEDIANANKVLAKLEQLEQTGTGGRQSLADILGTRGITESAECPLPSDNSEDGNRVRSIFGFPIFLQHVLRIWLKEKNRHDIPRILDRELLEIFNASFFQPSKDQREQVAEDVRFFIQLLWELRYLFDKHVIKWVDQGEEEQHRICSLRITKSITKSANSNFLSRDQEESQSVRGFSLLQSMLYHSQQITTQYWITPLLAFIRKHKGDVESYYRYLRHLDNNQFCTNESGSLIERTHRFLDNPWRCGRIVADDMLREPLGVKFPHYWFYKLEFILWFLGPDQHGINGKQAIFWEAFRFTAKNSVEHISPQIPQTVDRFGVAPENLDRFGNLSLVSRSVNSEYSNLPFNEKRERFMNRNQQRLDSLKMALIYQNNCWSNELIEKHEQKMIEVFSAYFDVTKL